MMELAFIAFILGAIIAGIFILLFLLFFAIIIAGSIFWLWMLVHAIMNKRLSDTEKALWVLVIIFTHLLGALIYFFAGRKSTRAYVQRPPVQPYQPISAQTPVYQPYQEGYQPQPRSQPEYTPPQSGSSETVQAEYESMHLPYPEQPQ